MIASRPSTRAKQRPSSCQTGMFSSSERVQVRHLGTRCMRFLKPSQSSLDCRPISRKDVRGPLTLPCPRTASVCQLPEHCQDNILHKDFLAAHHMGGSNISVSRSHCSGTCGWTGGVGRPCFEQRGHRRECVHFNVLPHSTTDTRSHTSVYEILDRVSCWLSTDRIWLIICVSEGLPGDGLR